MKITPLRLIILFLAKVHYNHHIKILDCPRGYTSSYALLQTNSARLGVTLADPLESSDINDDACIAKWQHPSPILPNDYRRLSLSLFSFFPIHPALSRYASNSFSPRVFHHLSTFLPHLPRSWIRESLTPWDNLQSRNEAWRSIPSSICRRNDRTRRGFSSLFLSLLDQDANKSSQTNIKWPRRTFDFSIQYFLRAGGTLREMIDATRFHA